ncbi:MAG: response regulator [Parcubacteria group bacterium]|nr:response regulator [Parcubacteria group bacterium]
MKKVSPYRVLIVEDDPFLLEMYSTKLSEQGIGVEIAEDGSEALEKMKGDSIDLVLLDIVMPKMDGLEVLQKMKGDPDMKSIPVILLTNLGQKEDVEKGLQLGAQEYIIKAHYTPTEVVAKVEALLKKSHS